MKYFLLFLIFVTSCSYRTKNEDDMQKQYNDIPEIVINELEFYDISKGIVKNKAVAERAEIFDNSRKSEIIMHNFAFDQYNNQNQKNATGFGEKATRFNRNGNVEISGKMDIHSIKEKAKINAEYLLWEDKSKRLVGKSDSAVSIIKDDGTFITGYGFSVESKKNKASFDNGVTGVFVAKKDSQN